MQTINQVAAIGILFLVDVTDTTAESINDFQRHPAGKKFQIIAFRLGLCIAPGRDIALNRRTDINLRRRVQLLKFLDAVPEC